MINLLSFPLQKQKSLQASKKRKTEWYRNDTVFDSVFLAKNRPEDLGSY